MNNKENAQYLLRLDDAAPGMDLNKWKAIEVIADSCGIKPIAAVVPDNRDQKLEIDEPDVNFWELIRSWQNKGWAIALHGLHHMLKESSGGLVPLNLRSEFAGVDLEEQYRMISSGYSILKERNVFPIVWVAPAHTFDRNTLEALKGQTEIRIISDGIALRPFMRSGFSWIPQQQWEPIERKKGVWTICLHPNNMRDEEFDRLLDFCQRNAENFTSIDQLIPVYRRRGLEDMLFAAKFYLRRRIKDQIRKFRKRNDK